ncbi:MAG: sodium:proton antiporter [Fusobacterium perfoetens]|uniref:Na+/H+ antiporter NhaC family protein n=1 Tax=Fusobacterium perfoetens TaxID=852 RepID=UPI0023F5397C|nr:Na+/H+ antiporter NhaC family protein [Fusobacterium perfoetens]MCI6152721.1 sodium:proton antiporter [Fusobacterium perfoetens]MDY3236615.1 Na+/H+ antiporter NhaC family protein [Fusobacterium perfoetens]
MKKIGFLGLLGLIFFYVFWTKFTLGLIVMGVYFLFILLSLKKKNTIDSIVNVSIEYSKKSKIVLMVFMFVGALTASWLASGTIPGIIYYGIKFINPNLFIFFSFLITSIVAFFLGSSFGAASTIGVALMAIARSGNIDVNIVGATIISGIYFGDRWSPLSSSANLVASLTGIDIYTNLKNMIKSMIIPYILTSIFYIFLSKNYVLNTSESNLLVLLEDVYNIDVRFIFIPVISIIIFSLLRINVRKSMAVSIILASIVAIFVQGENILKIFEYLLLGFYKFNGTSLETIIKGGGVKSMLNASALIIVSCSLVGVFEQLNILNYIKSKIQNVKTRGELFKNTVLVSIITGIVGANQTIAVIMTEQIIESVYDDKKIERKDLAKDIENTAIVLPAITPTNIACYVPCTMLGISNVQFIPFAVYIWLIPLCTYIYYRFILKNKEF